MSSTVRLQGPQGPYDVEVPRAEDDRIRVVHGDVTLHWHVEAMDGPKSSASGLTLGTERVWGDVYWFEFTLGPPTRIDYYGAGILVRSDHEARP